jgi:hypothetical protein
MTDATVSNIQTKQPAWNRIDVTGQRFGRLVVLSYLETRGKMAWWLCRCDCGVEKPISRTALMTKTKSCGCLHLEAIRAPRRVYKYKLSLDEAAINTVRSIATRQARTRGLVWAINDELLRSLSFGDCFYCGAHPSMRKKARKNAYMVVNGIDRVDNKLGYIPGNCVSCCRNCNRSKCTMSVKEFVKYILNTAEYIRVNSNRFGEFHTEDLLPLFGEAEEWTGKSPCQVS